MSEAKTVRRAGRSQPAGGRAAPAFELDTMVRPDARERTYHLLATRSPTKVVIDAALPEGDWYVVRSAFRAEKHRQG